LSVGFTVGWLLGWMVVVGDLMVVVGWMAVLGGGITDGMM
jgi:hypothetical protein